VAEPLYGEALDKGGLAPDQVLEAYVHLGSALAVLNKKGAALAAFKSAALIDTHFAVPAEAGKKAAALADQARQAQRAGALVFHASIPDHVSARAVTPVDVTLDAAHAASLGGSSIGITARRLHSSSPDPEYEESFKTAPTTHFDLPASLSLPSTTLRVRVDWLDTHSNRLASAEEQVHVQPLSNTAALAPLPLPVRTDAAKPAQPGTGNHKDFWHTAWPYVLGTAALAGGAVAIYFATRTPADVDVSGAHVMAQ
jgi:hypothetical protein